MKTFLFCLIISACALSAARAAEGIEIKNKSSFTMGQGGRNPFWPIGWKPVGKVDASAPVEHASGEVPATAFLVSSIMLDKGAHFAIINGKPMREGQQFGLQMGTQTYQITVKAILDGRVILARRDEEIIVPLRRK